MIFLIKTIFALGLSFTISIAGYRKKSLSLSGVIFSIIVGYIHMVSSFTISTSLITFFILGSLVTRFAKNEKEKMESEFKEGGQRTGVQVISNSFCSIVACLVYMCEIGIKLYDIPINYQINPIGSVCMVAAVSSLASSCGDTFSSEIGSVYSRSNPRLLIGLKKVPRGTNGGVSITGTLASGLGGFLVGMSSYICNQFSCHYFDVHDAPPQFPLIIIATLSGFIGSFIDSILGSLFQYSGINTKTGKIVNLPGPNVKYISGHNLLDNHNVNLISSTITGTGMAFSAFYLWPLLQKFYFPLDLFNIM